VGIIGPWNFPFNLTISPLAGVLAAGNRALIKPSELTPASSELLSQMFRESFDESEIAVVQGGVETGAAFSRLPFDHLVFTGSTAVARKVMAAAAESLVPLTLELGGKSPVIVSRSAGLTDAAMKIMAGKLFNAGQVCLAPDYVLAPAERLEEFAAECVKAVSKLYPSLVNNPDYSAIIHEKHVERLTGYLDDARKHGARVIPINPAGEDFGNSMPCKIAPALVLDTSDAMLIMQEEIFGPYLPVRGYTAIEGAVGEVNGRPRPLAFYYIGNDTAEEETVLNSTIAGGVTINDLLLHATVEDLPFGGIGPSGMGRYHGVHGFREFSHAKGIYRQSRWKAVVEFFRPPYSETTRKRIFTLAKMR
jgi:coniferyl-aldehyde dehydrogenase